MTTKQEEPKQVPVTEEELKHILTGEKVEVPEGMSWEETKNWLRNNKGEKITILY